MCDLHPAEAEDGNSIPPMYLRLVLQLLLQRRSGSNVHIRIVRSMASLRMNCACTARRSTHVTTPWRFALYALLALARHSHRADHRGAIARTCTLRTDHEPNTTTSLQAS